jgi:hypothetical protein
MTTPAVHDDYDVPISDHIPLPAVEREESWEFLPAGTVRKIRVNKDEIGKFDGRPFCVAEENKTRTYAEVKILGPSTLVHVLDMSPGRGKAYLETTASLYCRKDS